MYFHKSQLVLASFDISLTLTCDSLILDVGLALGLLDTLGLRLKDGEEDGLIENEGLIIGNREGMDDGRLEGLVSSLPSVLGLIVGEGDSIVLSESI
ncbi:predicted protein [Chaetoceros tenuissimus]|uniref:Uncharacterized protein n=1 Tax=Chaetoceros tenuissimus TaxID=426638 RepID=A0AAD3CWC7_9STRA|nr:predicted protein [Chaetoceros tenuissimus]